MIASIVTKLTTDAALMALLSGGVYNGQVVGEISRDTTPGAFDVNAELRPCALVQPGTDMAAGPLPTSSRLSFTIYLYERGSVASTEAARQRIYTLLQQTRLAPISGGAWEILHSEDVLGKQDAALRCSLVVSRYRVFVRKG